MTKKKNTWGYAGTTKRDPIDHCPVTFGLPTRMTEQGFVRACTKQRALAHQPAGTGESFSHEVIAARKKLNICAVCRGSHRPVGLEIIPLATLAHTVVIKQSLLARTKKTTKKQAHEGNTMAVKKDTRGTCAACNEPNMQLKSNVGGKQLCGKCNTIYSNARNWLPIVEQALADTYPGKYGDIAQWGDALQGIVDSKTDAVFARIAAASGYQGQDPDGLATRVESMMKLPEIQTLKNQLEVERKKYKAAENDIAHLRETARLYNERMMSHAADLDTLNSVWARATTLLGVDGDAAPEVLVDAVAEMAQTLDRYQKQCADLKAKLETAMQVNWVEVSADPLAPSRHLDRHLLDLAILTLRGEITGLPVSMLEAMREAA